MTNEWGPPLTGEEMKALKGRIDPAQLTCFLEDVGTEIIQYVKLPANHPYYKVREYNTKHPDKPMVLHCGSEARHPSDYDTHGLVLYAGSSVLCEAAKSCQKDFNQRNRVHVIAYTPKPKESEVTEQMYLIHKAGRGYYRPNSQGYTNDKGQAGRYTKDEAEKITHPNGPDGPRDGMTYDPEPSPTEQMPSDEVIEYVLVEYFNNTPEVAKSVVERNSYSKAAGALAELIQQYDPDRLKPAVDVAAERYSQSVDWVHCDETRERAQDAFKVGAAWQKENGDGIERDCTW